MHRLFLILSFCIVARIEAQVKSDAPVSQEEVIRIAGYLSHDSLGGRGNASAELLEAARFISDEFEKNQLLPLPGHSNFFIPFYTIKPGNKEKLHSLFWNNSQVQEASFHFIPAGAGFFPPKSLSDFEVIRLDTFFTEDFFRSHAFARPTLVWTSRLQPDSVNFFPPVIKMPSQKIPHDVLLVVADSIPHSVSVIANPALYARQQYNLVGILPGKSLPNEIIMFSAHYDHMGKKGVTQKGTEVFEIMNGANDNASGVTAVITLASYFSKRNDNERTLMFCAFSGEELGMIGSTDFSEKINAKAIVAMINIEMIGKESFGKNKVFITGDRMSDLSKMLQPGLKAAGIRVISGPSQDRMLFERSDNFPFAQKGIPAHTIMASYDEDPCYHATCDDFQGLNIKNMTQIINGIAIAVEKLVSGELTPYRLR